MSRKDVLGIATLVALLAVACGSDDGGSISPGGDAGVNESEGGTDAAPPDGGLPDGALPDAPQGEPVTFDDGFVPISLEVRDPVNVTRRLAPVSGGIPFARGAIQPASVDKLVLADESGHRVTTFQAPKILGTWSDGSVKWLLLDFQTSLAAGATATFKLGLASVEDTDDARIDIVEDANEYVVDTGAIRARLNKNRFSIFEQVWVDANGDGDYADGELVVDGPGEMFIDLDDAPPGDPDSGAYEYPSNDYLGMEGGNWLRTSTSNSSRRYLASEGDYEISIHSEGKSHVVFKLEGWHRAAGNARQFGKYTLYLHFYVGQGFVRASHTWIMTGDPNKNFIRRMALELPVEAASQTGELQYAFGGSFESDGEPVTFDPADPPYVPLLPGPSEVLGGRVDAGGQVSLVSIGPDKYYHNVPLGQAPAVEYSLIENGSAIASGVRPSGWGRVNGDAVGMTVGIRDFWREHPKEVQFLDGRLGAYLWPDHGGKTLDLRRRYEEVRGTVDGGWGKAARREFVEPGSAVGVAKTTEALFSFHDAARTTSVTDDEFRSFQDPLMPFASGEYNVSTGVFGPLVAYDPVGHEKVERYMDLMAARIVRSRQEYGWHGMMDVGDYLPEFEKQNWELDIPWNPDLYSNWGYAGWLQENYRFGQFAFVQYFRSGRYDYFRSADEWLRHARDVDCVYWDTPDDGPRPSDNKGASRLGGGHRHDQQHWGAYMAGYGIPTIAVVHHYYLTGDPRDLDAMRDNVAWILDAGSWIENYSEYAVLYMAEALGDADAMSRAWAHDEKAQSAFGRATYDSGMGLMMHDIHTDGAPEVRERLRAWAALDESSAAFLRGYLESKEQTGQHASRIAADFDAAFPADPVKASRYAWASRVPTDFRDAFSADILPGSPWTWPIRMMESMQFDGPGGMGNDLGRHANQMSLLWLMPHEGAGL